MNVFLSWSGKRSHLVAEALKQGLRFIFQNRLEIYLSTDMEKGILWGKALDEHLERAEFGILCVTKENFSAPWLMYEAGILYKTAGEGFVTPFLLDISPSELHGNPLERLQLTVFEKTDLRSLIRRVNQRLPQETRITDEETFQGLFEMVHQFPSFLERPPAKSLKIQSNMDKFATF